MFVMLSMEERMEWNFLGLIQLVLVVSLVHLICFLDVQGSNLIRKYNCNNYGFFFSVLCLSRQIERQSLRPVHGRLHSPIPSY
jgi:uncharacterized membrane protein